MKKLTTWALVLSIYITFIAPASMTANAQVIGKAMEQKMKDLPDGLKFRLSEGVEGAETRVKQQLPSTDPLSERRREQSVKANSRDKADAGRQDRICQTHRHAARSENREQDSGQIPV